MGLNKIRMKVVKSIINLLGPLAVGIAKHFICILPEIIREVLSGNLACHVHQFYKILFFVFIDVFINAVKSQFK